MQFDKSLELCRPTVQERKSLKRLLFCASNLRKTTFFAPKLGQICSYVLSVIRHQIVIKIPCSASEISYYNTLNLLTLCSQKKKSKENTLRVNLSSPFPTTNKTPLINARKPSCTKSTAGITDYKPGNPRRSSSFLSLYNLWVGRWFSVRFGCRPRTPDSVDR